MRKFLIVAIPIAALALFLFIMFSGSIFKRSFSEDDNVPESINKMIEAVSKEAWEEADSGYKELQGAWEKIIFRVQFGSERDEINKLSTSIARLEGAVKAEDKASSLMELYEAFNHWDELGN